MVSEFYLDRLLGKVLKSGSLSLLYPSGKESVYGNGEPVVALKVNNQQTVRNLLLNPDCALGEAYMRGDLTIEQGDIYDLIAMLFQNLSAYQNSLAGRVLRKVRGFLQSLHERHSVLLSARNVRRHYDIDEKIYRLFLDTDLQYSCAYFETETATLEQAQRVKKQRLIAKLNLPVVGRVLDIGCGWGGLALEIAQLYPGLEVTGITLSPRQLEVAQSRAAEAGVEDRVSFELKDYREVSGPFDRIVSVGMFEHVGLKDYGVYFRTVSDLLNTDGVALLHTIGRTAGPAPTNAWIRKYIFPGGRLPALSEIVPAIEQSGLIASDVEVLRIHYALTLKHWRNRFETNRHDGFLLCGEEFCRAWEFYLAASEASFRYLDHVVFQIQLAKSLGALPMTRKYMEQDGNSLALYHLAAE